MDDIVITADVSRKKKRYLIGILVCSFVLLVFIGYFLWWMMSGNSIIEFLYFESDHPNDLFDKVFVIIASVSLYTGNHTPKTAMRKRMSAIA